MASMEYKMGLQRRVMQRGDALEIIFKVRFPGWPKYEEEETFRSPEAPGAGAGVLVRGENTDGEADCR